MQDRNATNRDVRRIIAVSARLSSINQLKSDDKLGELDGVGLDTLALNDLFRNLNIYIEGVRREHGVVPNENDLSRSEFNGSLTVKETVDLVQSNLS